MKKLHHFNWFQIKVYLWFQIALKYYKTECHILEYFNLIIFQHHTLVSFERSTNAFK